MRPGEVKKVVSSQPATDGAGVNVNRLTGLKQITRINHVGLRVRSLEAARQFYAKLGAVQGRENANSREVLK